MALKPFLLSFGVAASLALPAIAQDTDGFERELDQTIRAACHSFMVDAIPDAFSWLRTEIYENSPFCQRVRNSADLEAFGEVVQDTFQRLGPDDARLDLSQKQDRDLNVTIECDSEYMCMEIRLAFQETDTPVSLSDYLAVQAYCDGRYGCIQAYFQDWPAPLPVPTPIADAEMIRFNEVVLSPDLTDTPVRSNAGISAEATVASADATAGSADASSTQPDAAATSSQPMQASSEQASSETGSLSAEADAAPAEGDPTPAEALFTMGPNQGWREASAYCAGLGRRLPSVSEAKALTAKIPGQDEHLFWYFGLWTSEASYVDAYVQRYRVVRPAGAGAENASSKARVACVK
jgi:hypothetical protein